MLPGGSLITCTIQDTFPRLDLYDTDLAWICTIQIVHGSVRYRPRMDLYDTDPEWICAIQIRLGSARYRSCTPSPYVRLGSTVSLDHDLSGV